MRSPAATPINPRWRAAAASVAAHAPPAVAPAGLAAAASPAVSPAAPPPGILDVAVEAGDHAVMGATGMAWAVGATAARMSAASAAATAVFGIARPSPLAPTHKRLRQPRMASFLTRGQGVSATALRPLRFAGRPLPPHQPPGPRCKRNDRQRRADLEIGPEADRHAFRASAFSDDEVGDRSE